MKNRAANLAVPHVQIVDLNRDIWYAEVIEKRVKAAGHPEARRYALTGFSKSHKSSSSLRATVGEWETMRAPTTTQQEREYLLARIRQRGRQSAATASGPIPAHLSALLGMEWDTPEELIRYLSDHVHTGRQMDKTDDIAARIPRITGRRRALPSLYGWIYPGAPVFHSRRAAPSATHDKMVIDAFEALGL